MTTPICPKCGSVRVKRLPKLWACQENDCRHVALPQFFKKGGPVTNHSHVPNRHWRDGAALSMDGVKS